MYSVRLYRRHAKKFVEDRAVALTNEADRYLEKGDLHNHHGEMLAVAFLNMFSRIMDQQQARTGAELRLKLLIIASRYYDQYDMIATALRPTNRDEAANLTTVAHEARYVGDTMRDIMGSMLN